MKTYAYQALAWAGVRHMFSIQYKHGFESCHSDYTAIQLNFVCQPVKIG